MPKRISKSARPLDVNQAAFQMVRRSTGTEDREVRPPRVSTSDISRVMAAMGRKGGKIGGKRRMETMTADERSQVAAKAANARWAKQDKLSAICATACGQRFACGQMLRRERDNTTISDQAPDSSLGRELF